MPVKVILSGQHDFPMLNIRSMVSDSISRMGYAWDECQWGSTTLHEKTISNNPKCPINVSIRLRNVRRTVILVSSLAELGYRNGRVRIVAQTADKNRLVVLRQLQGGSGNADYINLKGNQTGKVGTMATRSSGHTHPTEFRYRASYEIHDVPDVPQIATAN